MKTGYKYAYVLDVMSNDHPGIVAAVSDEISSRNGNIDAVSQTVLQGYFSLIIIVSFPAAISAEELSAAIEAHNESFQVMARPYQAEKSVTEAADTFVITAFGEDCEGIVHKFSHYLAGKDVNIIDLYGDHNGSEFVLIGQVQVPRRWDINHLQADLEEMGRESGYTVKLQHENIFVATNQLRFKSQKS
ncbi:MAG TPA: ACT domain-containing protein [Phycisphaerae bacterium]|nr:ACT domain-containing protein [Phycisphaerae bacterium]